MKSWILATLTLSLIGGLNAREHRGPPPVDTQQSSMPCPIKPCKSKKQTNCLPAETSEPKKQLKDLPAEACKPVCKKPDPCCPPVCFERGLVVDPCCIPSAYSEAAAIDLRSGANVFTTLNFIYWEAIQGGMDLAIPASIDGAITSYGNSVVFQETDYKPGFQVGLGFSGLKDHWVLYAEYTRLHASTSTSEKAQLNKEGEGVLIPSSWLPFAFYGHQASAISSKWSYQLDIVDGQISRPFYSGSRLVFEPFFGLRGAWFHQNMDLSVELVSPSDTDHVGKYKSKATAVGPRVGVNGNWLLGAGFKFIGNAAASLLYTGYDVSQHVTAPVISLPSIKMKLDDLSGLRPNLDLGLGFSWGSYFSCRRLYWELSATYDFSIFWEQNMMRYLADLSVENVHTNGAASNLSLHGLTIQTQFAF